jgi:hypothetical protein
MNAKHSAHVGYDDEFIYFIGELSSLFSGAVWLEWPLAFECGQDLTVSKGYVLQASTSLVLPV